MGFNILSGIGIFFKLILGFFSWSWRVIFTKIGLVGLLGWKNFIFLIIVLLYLGSSISHAVEEEDATIVFKDLGGLLISTDTEIAKETRLAIEHKDDYNTLDWILSFLRVLSNIYMFYFIYRIIFFFFNMFQNTSAPSIIKIMWATLIILVLRLTYISLMFASQSMSYELDFQNNVFYLLIPCQGLILFFQNISLWSIPIVNFAQTLNT